MISNINGLSQITQKINQSKDATEVGKFEETLKKATGDNDTNEIKEACMQMEHYMLSKIFKQMKANIESEDPLIPKGDYEKLVEDYLVDEQCKMLVSSGGIGLGEMMYQQMLRDL